MVRKGPSQFSEPYVRTLSAPCKGGAFQWVQIPPGNPLQPEAIGAVMEETKWLKPSISVSLVTARVCRPSEAPPNERGGNRYVRT